MRPFHEKSLTWTFLVIVLAGILATLGVLQYRSTQQVTDAAARDMEQALQSALFDFRHGMEADISTLCLTLLPSGEANSRLDLAELSRHLRDWRQTSPQSALLEEVLVWNGDDEQPTTLAASGSPRHTNWPIELKGLPEQLTNIFAEQKSELAENETLPERARQSPTLGPGAGFGWLFDQERLVLLHATVPKASDEHPHIQWLILPLNRKFFIQQLLPRLERDEFGSHSQTYQVAVILDGPNPSILYATEAGFGDSQSDSRDASLNLFGPPSLTAGDVSSHTRGLVFPVSPEASGNPPRLFVEPLLPSPPGPILTVIAKHRRGSVDAAVASLRQRNLAVGFGVLGVLAITLTLVVVTSHRARTLAQMQMDFVAGVSHELRTPLTAILLAAKNIEDGVVGANALVRYGSAIKSHAAQLSELVEEILLFTETHSGRHVYKIEPFDVALGIQNTLESLSPIVDASGFHVEENIAADLPLVQGDAAAFSQSLQNLITNSLKYGGPAQWVGIKASASENGVGREVCVSVQDRGIGIHPDDIKKIFEPFYRSPEVVDAQILGNGLGLPLTRTMIEAIGGKLTVASEPGQGSTFTIHLRASS